MATVFWTGGANAVAQVTEFTVTDASPADGEVWTLTCGNETVSVTRGAPISTVADIATALYDLLTELDPTAYPCFSEVEWADDAAGTLTATAKTAGLPFVITGSTDAASGTFPSTAVTAATGPNDVANVLNWSSGALPGASDDVILPAGGTFGLLYNLDALDSHTLNSFRRQAGFTGQVGLPFIHGSTGAAGSYPEYRDRYLVLGMGASKVATIGDGVGDHPELEHYDFQTADTLSIIVLGTGQPATGQNEACRILESHASATLDIQRGVVGLATEPGQTANIPTVRLGAEDSPVGDVVFNAGSGASSFSLTAIGGRISTLGALATVQLLTPACDHTHHGGNVTSLVTFGTFRWIGAGTIATLEIGGTGVVDAGHILKSRTVTNKVIHHKGSALLDPAGSITFSATPAHQNYRCDFDEFRLQLGQHRNWT